MEESTVKFLKVAVHETDKRRINILAAVHDRKIHDLVGEWVEDAWQDALQAGLVTDRMLEAPAVEG